MFGYKGNIITNYYLVQCLEISAHLTTAINYLYCNIGINILRHYC